MSTNPSFDEVDQYVDALLGDAIEPCTVEPRAPAADAHARAAQAASVVPAIAAPSEPKREPLPSPRAMLAPAALVVSDLAPAVTTGAIVSVPMSQRWLRVAIGNDSYALELLCVQEVVRVAPIVAMRGASHAVLGVMNLRGRIVPVFDLGLWLGTARVQPDERSRIVVVERDDELVGVLVTLVEDVVTLGRERIEPSVSGGLHGPVVGIARVGATPTVLLDAGSLFAAGNAN